MRKLLSYSLLALFVLNVAGYYLAYPVMAWCIKSTVRAGMEAGILEKKLVLVKIPVSLVSSPNAAFQMTDEDEFMYQGRMYDVSRSETHGSTVYYYCYADYDEDNLMAGLAGQVKSDTAATAPANSKKTVPDWAKSQQKEYLDSTNGNLSAPCRDSFAANSHCLGWHCKTAKPDIHSPPPKG